MSQPGMPPQSHVVYHQIVRPPSNVTATAAVILGAIALFFGLFVPIPVLGLFMSFVAVPIAIAAVILGHLGLAREKTIRLGRTPALLGLWSGYATIAITAATTIFWILSFVAAMASRP